jgi:hypothetical protein
MEVINCHDCERFVSFSASRCPHCGSAEPAGPYRFSKREARRFRIEDKNDNTLIVTTLAFGVIGALYGIAKFKVPSIILATIGAVGYGFLGLIIGALVAATFNTVRSLRYFLIPIGLAAVLLAYKLGILFR